MNKIRTVVVDDEYFNRGLITMLIGNMSERFEIVGEAENLRDGYKMVERLNPDVVFLDIKMPDGSGFELLRMFDRLSFEVVFVTGFDDFTLKAFEFNALDYILKPIDLDKFKQTLDKIEYRYTIKKQQQGLSGGEAI